MTKNIFAYKELDNIKAVVDVSRCDGCALCLDVCPFKAISIVTIKSDNSDSFQRTISIDDDLCQGCGLCQGTCPKRGVYIEGFSLEEISELISTKLQDSVVI